MITDLSYGIIPLRLKKEKWEVLLVQHQAGHWSFPKGHPEAGESPLEAAKRELEEETALKVERYLSQTPFNETYFFTHQGKKIHKTVSYFPAIVTGKPVIQEEEIQACRWIAVEEAHQLMTFPEGKRICREIGVFLSEIQ